MKMILKKRISSIHFKVISFQVKGFALVGMME